MAKLKFQFNLKTLVRFFRFRLRTLLVLITVVGAGIAVYHQWGRGLVAEYRAKQWVLDNGGTITYIYHSDTRYVRVVVPEGSYDPSPVFSIKAIRGLREVSFWGVYEFILVDEEDLDPTSNPVHMNWERFEKIIEGIERLHSVVGYDGPFRNRNRIDSLRAAVPDIRQHRGKY